MNYTIAAIDYLLQTKEQTGKYDLDAAYAFLFRFREHMTRDEYTQTYKLLWRIAG